MKKSIFVLCMAAACVLAMTGCKEKKKSQTADPAVEVKVATASGETIPDEVEFTANIEPWQKNYISPALQGARVSRIFVNVGDRVRKGQLVAEMDPTQYNTAKVQYETAAADYKRVKTVFEAGGVSAQSFQQVEAQYLVAKEQLDNLARNVKLYSPIEGVVTAKDEEEGNLVTTRPIMEIMQIDRLKVRVNISESYFAAVHRGSAVSIAVDIYPDERFAGSVTLVSPAIDPATRTFMAEVTIPNASGKLRPGMFARSTINMGDRAVVLVPDVAVQKQIGTNERFVYVVESGVIHRRTVTPGRQIGPRVVIDAGLGADETVAVTSFSRLADGASVQVVQ